jgi:hypothetical protein
MKIEYKISLNDSQIDEITVNTLISDYKQTGIDGLQEVQKAIFTLLSSWYMTPDEAKKAVEED